MKNRVITISREFGSGGRTIGKQAAERLGIPCYDQELVEQLAKELGLPEDYVQENSESTEHKSWIINVLSENRDFRGMSQQDYLWQSQKQAILHLAEQGPCVIVGRCADYILQDTADCLKVFVHASLEKRAARILQVYGDREDKPEKRLRDKDKRRRAYYQYYTDTDWGDMRNYHITLDSGVLGIERCAELIAGLY